MKIKSRFRNVTAFVTYDGRLVWRAIKTINKRQHFLGYFPFTPQGEERAQQAVVIFQKQQLKTAIKNSN